VHAFDVVGDPIRRRILELLVQHDLSAGQIGDTIQREFGISQPGVSTHLRVLREAGFAQVQAEGARRLYSIDPGGLQEVDAWLDRFRQLWVAPLDALATEVARGGKQRQTPASPARTRISTASTPKEKS
jgi:DNA-binding transcriptional ArsR family regulator